jgi:hypothetical protein
MRTASSPLDARSLHALAAALDGSARALANYIGFLRAEASGLRMPVEAPIGDSPYDGLDLAQAVLVLGRRFVDQFATYDDDLTQRVLDAEVERFVAGVQPPKQPRSAPRRRPAAEGAPDADAVGKARTDARATSKKAALDVLPKSGQQRRKVLDAVAAVARDPRTVGLTDVEIQRATSMSPNSERPRRVELVEGGWLQASDQTREHYGSEHTVWVLTDKAAGAADLWGGRASA